MAHPRDSAAMDENGAANDGPQGDESRQPPSASSEEPVSRPAGREKSKAPDVLRKMHKFSVYETSAKYYIVGGDVTERRYRMLVINRNTHESGLSMVDDEVVLSQEDMNALLDSLDRTNKPAGGLKLRCTAWGILGFIKFTGPYYMLLITKKSTIAMIGGHYVYQVEGTDLVPLTPPKYKADVRNPEESRFLAILNNLDLTRSFYYSYSYNITRTLQHNLTRERMTLIDGLPRPIHEDLNAMFVWNDHLLQPARRSLANPFDWCRPIIHGYVDQAALFIYGRIAYITIIARRSRHFAGARFLKRGVNDLGYVANDVETEQIVSDVLTTSFHGPGAKPFSSPQYTSYVQHRGSIPLHWSQDNIGVTPKPPIEINLVDPFYSAAALHFDDLFRRYGAPIFVLNLIKSRERTPRESKLLTEYTAAINYLNQFLPEGKKIIHRAWDMSRAAKSRDQDVIGTLESIAEEVVRTTGFFHNGDGTEYPTNVQNGVARTNCIDCLDRTNAAQFVIGKRALGHQLHVLGILEDTSIGYDTDAVNLFTHMYHDHGDTIAMQYGGSQLVNTMETYRRINQWTSHSRDMIESFKRYYNNSFLDGQRQEAYNLFLGNYIFSHGQPMLWDLSTDYYLHHADPRAWNGRRRRDYTKWYTPEHLETRTLPPLPPSAAVTDTSQLPDDYWLEYYRPSTLSSFLKMFPYRMNSTVKYIPIKSIQEGRYDWSPFRVRSDGDVEASDRKKGRKDLAIAEDQRLDRVEDDASSIVSEKSANAGRSISIQRWLQPLQDKATPATAVPTIEVTRAETADVPGDFAPGTTVGGISGGATPTANGAGNNSSPNKKPSALDKSRAAQRTFRNVVYESLNPTVSRDEANDYAQYVSHPQSLPLVVSAADEQQPATAGAGATGGESVDAEYLDYVRGPWRTDPGWWSTSAAPSTVTADYAELLRVADNPLTVTEEDALKKRYKAYGKWLIGKSLFKQQPVD